MTQNLSELCQGHLIHITKRCEKCRADDFNKRCENYKPLYILIYNVEAVGEAALDNEDRTCPGLDDGGMYR